MALKKGPEIPLNPNINIEENWTLYKQELLNTKRDGVQDMLVYLENKTDAKIAPASGKYHNSAPGGLTDHHLNVLKFLRQLHKELRLTIPPHTLTIVALLHDLCKVNFYIRKWVLDKEWKDKTDEWRQIEGYAVEHEAPLGHGEKSLSRAQDFLKLTMEEKVAIRWHMGKWDVSEMVMADFRQALDSSPLCKLLMIADQLAELYETTRPTVPEQTSIFPS